jgi:hypothetical protein
VSKRKLCCFISKTYAHGYANMYAIVKTTYIKCGASCGDQDIHTTVYVCVLMKKRAEQGACICDDNETYMHTNASRASSAENAHACIQEMLTVRLCTCACVCVIEPAHLTGSIMGRGLRASGGVLRGVVFG